VNITPLAIVSLMSMSALHAEWKVATVRITDLFDQMPEVQACREELEVAKEQIPKSGEFQEVEKIREEFKKFEIEERKVLFAYQRSNDKDVKGPEAEKVREFAMQRKNF
jgi:hypothetical protein